MDLLGIFLTALFMALAHCVGMCGGIVVAYSGGKLSSSMPLMRQAMGHLLYNSGRITTYMLLGLVCGLVGYQIHLNAVVSAYFLIVLGVLLVGFALLYAFFPRVLSALEPNIARLPFYRRLFAYLLGAQSPASFYLLGMLNGFLPCGMVYYFLTLSLASTSIWGGVVSMGVFGLATSIPLFVLGFALGLGSKVAKRKIFLWLGFVGMLALGGWNIYQGVMKLQGRVSSHMHHGGMQSPHTMHNSGAHNMHGGHDMNSEHGADSQQDSPTQENPHAMHHQATPQLTLSKPASSKPTPQKPATQKTSVQKHTAPNSHQPPHQNPHHQHGVQE